MTPPPYPRYEISLSAIQQNFRAVRQLVPAGTTILCCLKRDAYGCGAGPVAQALAQAGADGFAVASLRDAKPIRHCAPHMPILLYGGTLPTQVADVEALDLTITIGSREDARGWNAVLLRKRRVFLKVDVGLIRFGFNLHDFRAFLTHDLPGLEKLDVVGLYCHFAEKPDATKQDIAAQKATFDQAVAMSSGHLPNLAHICASSSDTVIANRELDYNCVDVGAILFGIASAEAKAALGLKSAITRLVARLVNIKTVDNDMPRHIVLPRSVTRLGIADLGWGDGLPRNIGVGGRVLVRGCPAPLLGPSHLEQIRLDLSGIDEARSGDEVVFLGEQGGLSIDEAEIADAWGIQVDELYCSARGHIAKYYQ